MELHVQTPRKALNKAFLKVKPIRTEIESFKANLMQLIERIDDRESEEFHKNLVGDFLKKTYYDPKYFINTKGRNDQVIHNGENAKSTVGVIVEAKKLSNKNEMLKPFAPEDTPEQMLSKINVKAFHELILYYLRERITHNNIEVKHLIVTNIYEWYIFDATLFDRLFAQNKNLVKQFTDFEGGRLADTKTDFFYKQIAEPVVSALDHSVEFTYFNIRDYETPLRNADLKDDNKLIALFKLLSPEHLLKLPFSNDSNSLDKRFYSELLHIIGLVEIKEGGKKLIGRNKEGERHTGSLIENAILRIDSLDKISEIEKIEQYGSSKQEKLYNVALEISITWINRILFLKLLEAQLISYYKGDISYSFLNIEMISSYDDLNSLFFEVLACRPSERNEEVKALFSKVPYLNSSLFEVTKTEKASIAISNLRDDKPIPYYSGTILKDDNGKRRQGELSALQYLFEFLNAYDFASEGSEDIQEENKTLINASVLGLIFEKINGYKDGSFFTPGFITMYMARETIRRAVVQKFNDAKGWACADVNSLYNKIEDTTEANQIVNSLKICDPAVGSGHFLVSALNELIAIKSDLDILVDRDGKRLKNYHFEVVNDELIVSDEDGEFFEYNPSNKESQRVQEALFHEKQTIIENCLFGVDINSNSVKICSLRLWIELLKNAYYKNETELETLPNIDINIKCGNSLVSRFPIDADIKQALKKSKWNIDSYRMAIQTYRNAPSKEVKREMEALILSIKQDFSHEIRQNDPLKSRLDKLASELYNRFTGSFLFEVEQPYGKSGKDLAKRKKKEQEKLEAEIEVLTNKINEIKSDEIYKNAFEWRFEFPEVLDDNGVFMGFDVVIGNPPYIRQEEIKDLKLHLKSHYNLYSGTADVYVYFIEKGFDVLKNRGEFTFILPNKFMQAGYGQPARKFLLTQNLREIVDFGDYQVFDEATTYPCILSASKSTSSGKFKSSKINSPDFALNFPTYVAQISNEIDHQSLTDETWMISDADNQLLVQKIISNGQKLEDYIGETAKRGVLTGLTEAFLIDDQTKINIIEKDANSAQLIKPFLLGRDIKPYLKASNTNWLILVPKGFTIKKNLPPDKANRINEPIPRYGFMEYDAAWNWFLRNYPGIANHLLPFKEKAEQRTDKGDFWWELRACDYYDKFEMPKVLYQVLQVKPCFIYDEEGLYCNNSMWFIPTSDKALLGILNSKLGWWLISNYCSAIQNGYQLIWKYFSQIPIATGNEPVRKIITTQVNEVLNIKKQNPTADTTALEREIDELVFKLYDLTYEEVKIIAPDFWMSEAEYEKYKS